MPTILGLDLGTDTGVAFYDGNGISAACWKLATAAEITQWGKDRSTRRGDPRVFRFFDSLNKFVVRHRPEMVVFEDVEFQTFTKQTQLWSSFRTVVWLVARNLGATCECVRVSTLKKFATGHGGATKNMMGASLFKQHPEFGTQKLNDDAVDAVWVCLWGINRLGRIKP